MTLANNTMKKRTKKTIATVTACAMLGAVAVGGTLAYLTDNETTTNTITIGEVSADLLEPSYPGNDSDDVKLVVPAEEIAKDPQVKNTGENDAIIFLKVEVPAKSLDVVDLSGSVKEDQVKDLVYFKLTNDPAGTLHTNNFNDGDTADDTDTDAEYWVALPDLTSVATTDDGTSTYVFGYSKAVGAGSTTEALFDKIQLVNSTEDDLTVNTAVDIKVTAYAIQATDIYETSDSTESLTKDLNATNLDKIYDIFITQQGNRFEADDAEENGDIKALRE